VEQAALQEGVTQEEWAKFVAYVAGFYDNMGNYAAYGHAKFVPDLTPEVFEKILTSNPLYRSENAFYKEVVDELYHEIKEEIFNTEKATATIGKPYEGQVSAYYSRDMTKQDLELVAEFAAE